MVQETTFVTQLVCPQLYKPKFIPNIPNNIPSYPKYFPQSGDNLG
jgi:hypothetical protein